MTNSTTCSYADQWKDRLFFCKQGEAKEEWCRLLFGVELSDSCFLSGLHGLAWQEAASIMHITSKGHCLLTFLFPEVPGTFPVTSRTLWNTASDDWPRTKSITSLRQVTVRIYNSINTWSDTNTHDTTRMLKYTLICQIFMISFKFI